MRVLFHKNFKKQYKKLRVIQGKIDEKLTLFIKDPFNETLNNHSLSGKHKGHRSIDITGDYRGLYIPVNNDLAYFITVDTHSNLYK